MIDLSNPIYMLLAIPVGIAIAIFIHWLADK